MIKNVNRKQLENLVYPVMTLSYGSKKSNLKEVEVKVDGRKEKHMGMWPFA